MHFIRNFSHHVGNVQVYPFGPRRRRRGLGRRHHEDGGGQPRQEEAAPAAAAARISGRQDHIYPNEEIILGGCRLLYKRDIICPRGEFQVVCCLVRETEIGKLFFDFDFVLSSPLLLEYLVERELNFVTEFIFSGGKPCVGDQKVKYILFQLDL